MCGCARSLIVTEGEVGVYHCWSRLVQRACLMGPDPVTGRDLSHRRDWLESLLEYQASVFAVDLGTYNLLSNHWHLIARTRPDIVAQWTNWDVAVRWKLAYPSFVDGRWVREPTDREVREVINEPGKLEKVRTCLGSLSWFMARWKEPIAKICNAESKTSGHFWAERFQCRKLEDEAAVLTCSVYVDLNQVRAGMCREVVDSRYSAIRTRMLETRSADADQSYAQIDPGPEEFSASDLRQLFSDCCFSPITARGPLMTDPIRTEGVPKIVIPRSADDRDSAAETAAETAVDTAAGGREAAETDDLAAADDRGERESAGEPAATSGAGMAGRTSAEPEGDRAAGPPAGGTPQREQATGERVKFKRRRRASDSAVLAMPLEQYLEIVEAAAQRVRETTQEPGGEPDRPLPASVQALLEARGIKPGPWLVALGELQRRSGHLLGPPARLVARAAERKLRWVKGIQLCRDVFG